MTLGLKRGCVKLMPHQEEWHAIAQDTIKILLDILGGSAVDIQHIGSTAIKNIEAKPIIDIAVGVRRFEDIEPYITVLEENGIIFRGDDNDGQLFVIGDFACESYGADICKTVIKPRKYTYKPGDVLLDYGRVELTAKLHIPADAKAIELEGALLYTEFYIDGVLAGEGIYAPYVFKIDEEYRNKTVEVKIIQYSNIGAVFGDVEYFTENSKTTNWKTPSPVNASFGMKKLNFIL